MLNLLRVIKSAGDEQTQELYADYDIGNEQFIVLANADTKRIAAIRSALNCIAENQLAPKRLLDRALTETQLADYRSCCQQPTSFDIEYREADFPLQFVRYLNYVQDGDRYTALAQSARKRRSVKRDARGRTAESRYIQLAETSYESAIMELIDLLEPDPQMPFDQGQAALIQSVLDRPFDGRVGYEPSADCIGIPRLKTSRSKYTIKNNLTPVSKHEHQLRCQRDALIPAALELLYGKQERQQDAHVDDKLRNKLAQLKKAMQ